MPRLHTCDELSGWLRLSMEPRLGVAAYALLRAFGTPDHIYASSVHALSRAVPERLARQLAAPADAAQRARWDAAQNWVLDPDHHIVTLGDQAYPPLLLELADPPLLLYVRGDPAALVRPSLAMVGARSASAAGEENAVAFAHSLARDGWCVVSGLARGIDAAAHAGALRAGEQGAGTIAILGTGIDRIYPAGHTALAARIVQNGALMSELPLGAAPLRHHFPRRNRLVAGLTRGVLIVEAARQSGSLITARLAADYGREVFAIPGSIHSPLSRGCHALIRQGAKLVETAADIADEFGASGPVAAPAPPPRKAPCWPRSATSRRRSTRCITAPE